MQRRGFGGAHAAVGWMRQRGLSPGPGDRASRPRRPTEPVGLAACRRCDCAEHVREVGAAQMWIRVARSMVHEGKAAPSTGRH
eukprot:4461304-Alexandrium_andersonii.AAC.1